MIIPCPGKKRTERGHGACSPVAFPPRLGLQILPVQGVLTTGTVLGLDWDDRVHRLDGHDHPRLPRMAWLPSALASTRPTACTCRGPQSSGGWPTNQGARQPTLGLKPHMFAGPRHDYCGPLPLCHGPLILLSEHNPTATLLEHTLLTQGFTGISEAALPRRLRSQNRDSTWANLVNALK